MLQGFVEPKNAFADPKKSAEPHLRTTCLVLKKVIEMTVINI